MENKYQNKSQPNLPLFPFLQTEDLSLKVCGMKFTDNMQQVAALQPDYLGFIFYEKSKRNFEGIIPELPKGIKKTGVFVNEFLEIVVSLAEEYRLDAIQLHGDESVEYIVDLKKQIAKNNALFLEENKQITKKKNKHYIAKKAVEIIKVFGIKDDFNFEILQPYLQEVDYFLFDTKGKERGGNGVKFDWSVLKKYPFRKPFFLSGGIGLEDLEQLQIMRKTNLPIYAIDINSKFEIEPGKKKIEELKKFKQSLNM